ncbi:MAG: sensor histidine kinase, partial [Veillonella sp.]|nr:sensor histidine kinase [Veillonella sp.]
FYRVDSSRTNPQEGSGLGLSIIRRIMEIFEGRVVIENVRPHGLRIILEFPKQGEES